MGDATEPAEMLQAAAHEAVHMEEGQSFKIKAAFFDLDGTLLDTIEDIADSMNLVLEENGLPIYPIDSYKGFVGDGIRELVRRTLPETSRTAVEIDRMVEAMTAEYNQRWRMKTKLYPGIGDMLEMLVENGIRLAVISNKPDPFTRIMVETLLGNWPFEHVIGAESRFPRKPAPDAVLFVARAMGIDPSQCIYLGDTSIDMITAKRAQMTAIGVTWGFRTRDELLEYGAEFLIDHPMELAGLPIEPFKKTGDSA